MYPKTCTPQNSNHNPILNCERPHNEGEPLSPQILSTKSNHRDGKHVYDLGATELNSAPVMCGLALSSAQPTHTGPVVLSSGGDFGLEKQK